MHANWLEVDVKDLACTLFMSFTIM